MTKEISVIRIDEADKGFTVSFREPGILGSLEVMRVDADNILAAIAAIKTTLDSNFWMKPDPELQIQMPWMYAASFTSGKLHCIPRKDWNEMIGRFEAAATGLSFGAVADLDLEIKEYPPCK